MSFVVYVKYPGSKAITFKKRVGPAKIFEISQTVFSDI